MKIALIQLDFILGSRILLSLLREKGYEAKSLQINIRYTDLLSQEDLDIIYGYVKGSDVVGLSFTTFHALVAKQLAIFLKKKSIKYIITGGNHVTALPDEAIAFSDIVITYEAEITLLKVLEALKERRDLSGIKGVIYKKNGSIVRNNEAHDIVWELDTIPFQSVDVNVIKYFNFQKKLYTPDKSEIFPHSGNCYFILASRGCPFKCTYCFNTVYHSIDKRFGRVRKRTIGNILDEMEYALSNGFESFRITDDHFFSFSLKEIESFNEGYKKRIKKPFSVMGVNPNNFKATTTEEKLKLLLDCGMTDIRIGIQSGSNKTLTMFNRGYKAEDIPKLLAPIEKHRNIIRGESPHDRLHVALDFICDAPWEDEADKKATIKLAQKVLKQYTIFFYTLVYFPKTVLYEKALKNGWIDNKKKDIYMRGIAGVDDNIYNRVLFLIAVTKERGIALSEELIDHILELSPSNQNLAESIVDSFINSIVEVEKHHNVKLKHAVLHPYLTGFNKWTKTVGKVGKKVLFRSYHEPYG